MVFQPKGRAAPGVTIGPGGLLPHLLILTPVARGGYFLPRYHILTDIFFTEVRCSMLPGLSFPRQAGNDGLSCWIIAKLGKSLNL